MSDRKIYFIEIKEEVTAAQLKLLTTLFQTAVVKSDGRVFVGGGAISATELKDIIIE